MVDLLPFDVDNQMSNQNWIDVVNSLPKLPQRQDSTADQLVDLIMVANKLGMYDAADVIRSIVNPRPVCQNKMVW